jgi:hypothetical protein
VRRVVRELVASGLLGWGVLMLPAPLLLYWFIHGDYDRYVWIINGPYPFDSMGSGPFQAAMGLALLWSGAFFVLAGLLLKVEKIAAGSGAALLGSLPIAGFLLSFGSP